MKKVICPCCEGWLFSSNMDVKVALLTKSNQRTADLILKCKKGGVIATRFPRNTNPDIKLAKGTEMQ